MICKNCGDEIAGGDRYCSSCGMELYVPEHRPDHKPLQRKFLRGEYLDEEEEFYEEDQVYYEDKTEYEREYYYEEPKKSSGLLSTFLILLIALVVGFVIGIFLFSGNLQSIPINMG